MNKRIKIGTILLFVAAFFMLGFLVGKTKRLGDNISCYTQVSYRYLTDGNKVYLDTQAYYHLAKGKGVITYNGNFIYGGVKYNMHRTLSVSYELYNKNTYFIQSLGLKRSPIDNIPANLERKLINSVYYQTDGGGTLNFLVKKDHQGSFLFISNQVPQFLCSSKS